MIERNMRRYLISAVLCLLLTCGAFAQGLDLGIWRSVPSAASPTWTAQTAAGNNGCGFSTSCSVTGVPVTSGFIVAGVGGTNDAAGASTVSALTVCGTSLTLISSPSVASGAELLGLFAGTVTGGSCTLTATASGAGAFNGMSVALGTLSNLTSTTPGTLCTGVYGPTQDSPYPCTTGSITVAAGGFGIAVFGVSTPLTSTNLTVDATDPDGQVGIGHTTVSETPSFNGAKFVNAVIIAAPWR
jgi:hypothetical protein